MNSITAEIMNSSPKDHMSVWQENNHRKIREVCAKLLDDLEFFNFVQLGMCTGLNPMKGEIWAVKYDRNKAAQVFIGINGYRTVAVSNSDYDYHQVCAVYSTDHINLYHDRIEYKRDPSAQEGKLIGAFCIVKRKSSSQYIYVYVKCSEYSKNQSTWNDKPEVMIKKCAEACALRATFPTLFNGTYIEEEVGSEMTKRYTEQSSGVKNLKNLITMKKEIDNDRDNIQNNNISNRSGESDIRITSDNDRLFLDEKRASNIQIGEIRALSKEKALTKERLGKALNYFNVEIIEQLSEDNADKFISMLKKMN